MAEPGSDIPEITLAASHAYKAGLCVVPPVADGSKAPLGVWKQYQTERPSREQMHAWYADGRASGIGIICGRVSGGLEMLEFEGRAVDEGIWGDFVRAAAREGAALDDIMDGYMEITPSGGIHLLYRCDEIEGNRKLARRPATESELATNPDEKVKVLIETRGEGGYVIVAPTGGTVHPTGQAWELDTGGFGTIRTITAEQRRQLFDIAARFDTTPTRDTPPPAVTRPTPRVDDSRPGDEFNQRHTSNEVLETAGFTFHSTTPDGRRGGQATNYTRPGKNTRDGSSATVWGDGRCTIFSSSVDVPYEVDDRRRLSPWQLHVHLNHHGDFTEAAREWRRQHPSTNTASAATLPAPAAEVDEADYETFWTARPELQHIRNYALSKRASPWASLGVALVRVITATPPAITLPDIIGSQASLNLFIGLVGPSGGGKGAAVATGTEAVTNGLLEHIETHTPGSGHGIAHAYAHREKGDLVRDADAALFTIEEVDHLIGLSGQTGSTLLAELRRVYMAEKLGHLFVDPTKRIPIDAHSYRAGLIVGIQPTRAAVLLDDADGGTPQRFVWLPTSYPHPDQRPPAIQPWKWQPPRFVRGAIHVCDTAVHEIDQAALARSRGEGNPLDGHRLLCREKVAAALGLLNGRAEINDDDWELSAALMDVSDRTRNSVIAALAHDAARRNAAKAKAEGERAVIVTETVEQQKTKAAIKHILRHLQTGPVDHSDLRRKMWSKTRPHFEDAIEALITTGQIVQEDIGTGGVRYRLTEASR